MAKNFEKGDFPRHQARRTVLQALFTHLITSENNARKLLGDVQAMGEELPAASAEFAHKLLAGSIDGQKIAESVIEKVTKNWALDRIGNIDRCILIMSITEFLLFNDISPNIVIDEAVELAKEFGTVDSQKFVNGVLDAAWHELLHMQLVGRR